jgi:purine-nucleoside phosphorylase
LPPEKIISKHGITVAAMDPSFIPYRLAAAYLLEKLAAADLPLPAVGIICGSGLSELSDALEGTTLAIQYGDIPGFPEHCTVAGHKGEVVFGLLGDVPTMCFRGRFHSYEGHDMKTVVLPVHVMRCLQVQVVIVTNAAGGLNPSYHVGDVAIVTDHLAIPSLAGKNSLVGPNDDALGPRFPPTSDAYPETLRQAAEQAAAQLRYDFVRSDGACYCFVSGPMYESKAECKFLRAMGGDTVGMSTVPEVVAAHHCGIKVLCLSLVTNKVIIGGDEGPAASHAEVLEAVGERAIQMQTLVKEIMAVLKKTVLPTMDELPPIDLKVPRQSSAKGGFFGIPTHCILSTGVIVLTVSALFGTRLVKINR